MPARSLKVDTQVVIQSHVVAMLAREMHSICTMTLICLDFMNVKHLLGDKDLRNAKHLSSTHHSQAQSPLFGEHSQRVGQPTRNSATSSTPFRFV